jgi:phosphatidylglycerophosphatase A
MKQLLRSPVLMLGFGFGSGLAPKAPGTVGTLLGVLLFLPLLVLNPLWAWILFVLATLAGVWICGQSARLMGVHDHGGIVWDEFAGVWLVLLCLPEQSLLYWLAAFVVFRVFDIAKPWPIRWVDQSIEGGLGIMLDDLLAAAFAIGFIWATTMSLNWLF